MSVVDSCFCIWITAMTQSEIVSLDRWLQVLDLQYFIQPQKNKEEKFLQKFKQTSIAKKRLWQICVCPSLVKCNSKRKKYKHLTSVIILFFFFIFWHTSPFSSFMLNQQRFVQNTLRWMWVILVVLTIYFLILFKTNWSVILSIVKKGVRCGCDLYPTQFFMQNSTPILCHTFLVVCTVS